MNVGDLITAKVPEQSPKYTMGTILSLNKDKAMREPYFEVLWANGTTTREFVNELLMYFKVANETR